MICRYWSVQTSDPAAAPDPDAEPDPAAPTADGSHSGTLMDSTLVLADEPNEAGVWTIPRVTSAAASAAQAAAAAAFS
jgi:hypothetical protein